MRLDADAAKRHIGNRWIPTFLVLPPSFRTRLNPDTEEEKGSGLFSVWQSGPGCLQHSDQCHPEFEAIHPADFLVIGGGGCCATGMAKPQEVTAPTQFSQQNTVTSCCCTALFASKRATQSLRSIGATLRSDSMSSRLLILLTVTISLISAPALAQKAHPGNDGGWW